MRGAKYGSRRPSQLSSTLAVRASAEAQRPAALGCDLALIENSKCSPCSDYMPQARRSIVSKGNHALLEVAPAIGISQYKGYLDTAVESLGKITSGQRFCWNRLLGGREIARDAPVQMGPSPASTAPPNVAITARRGQRRVHLADGAARRGMPLEGRFSGKASQGGTCE